LLGKPGQCSVDLLITQNMRVGARNGRINNYSRTTIASKEVMREVKILQKHMNRLGFSSGVEDGILGPITDGAIKRMQKFLGTYQDGLVGPMTRSLINNSCGK
jgi:murein L,D-transpeptidase YcbB/YkuD